MEAVQSFVNHFLSIAGNIYLGLFLFVWLFSAFNPASPPEEAFTLLGGACMAMGLLHPLLGSLAIIAGIIATNISQYWMGRGGIKLISKTRLGNRLTNSRKFMHAREVMSRKGMWAIVCCRFFFGTRAPTYLASGFLRYPFLKFVLIDTTMVLVHAIPLLIIGYIFSDQIKTVLEVMEKLGIWSLIILLAMILGFFGIQHLRNRRKTTLPGGDETSPSSSTNQG